jgi:hypothetical protein
MARGLARTASDELAVRGEARLPPRAPIHFVLELVRQHGQRARIHAVHTQPLLGVDQQPSIHTYIHTQTQGGRQTQPRRCQQRGAVYGPGYPLAGRAESHGAYGRVGLHAHAVHHLSLHGTAMYVYVWRVWVWVRLWVWVATTA